MSAQVHDRITIEPDKMDGQPEDIPAALNYAAEALAEHYYTEAACVRFLIDMAHHLLDDL